ncbi:hypothetical protein [Euzebya tangerina]|uniref:hypothetical protein n=1 Tax=Euzebya tangerina TaxID=591198 RepID=UPI000E31EBA9|nr:hypothetical protein [Euzebya tangerina]
MRRFTLAAAFAAVAVLMAVPAWAQDEPTVYGGNPDTPEEAEDQVRVTTACSTIIVQGDNWGGSEVTIDREFGGDNCPGSDDPEPPDVIEGDTDENGNAPGTDDDDSDGFAGSPSTAEQLQVAVNDDGSFRAVLQVPADVDTSTYEVTVTGQDLDGQAKEQVVEYSVTPASLFTPDLTPADDNRTTYAVVALLLASVLLVGLNWSPIMRRVRR